MDKMMNASPDPASEPMTHAFTNPGTAGHVAGELEQTVKYLYTQRGEVQERYDEQTNQYEAVHRDLTERIMMAEAAVENHRLNRPQPDVPQSPVGRLG